MTLHVVPDTPTLHLVDEQPAADQQPVGLTAPQAVRIAGITYRQLDYWANTGLVTPSGGCAHGTRCTESGSGHWRRYTVDDAVRLAAVQWLLHGGLSLSFVREHLDWLLNEVSGHALAVGPVTVALDVPRIRATAQQRADEVLGDGTEP